MPLESLLHKVFVSICFLRLNFYSHFFVPQLRVRIFSFKSSLIVWTKKLNACFDCGSCWAGLLCWNWNGSNSFSQREQKKLSRFMNKK